MGTKPSDANPMQAQECVRNVSDGIEGIKKDRAKFSFYPVFSLIGPAGFEPTTSTTPRLKHTDLGPTKTKRKSEIRIWLHQRLHLESIAVQLREQLSADELRDLIALLSSK